MAASIKVDEDLPPAVAQAFRQAGHDVSTVLEQGWSGCPDDVLLARIRAEGRWLLTADRGFADVRQYPPGSHAGIIVFQTAVESRRRYRLGRGSRANVEARAACGLFGGGRTWPRSHPTPIAIAPGSLRDIFQEGRRETAMQPQDARE